MEVGGRMLSVCIATKNRPADVSRCVRSILHLSDLNPQVLIMDDGSDPPVEAEIRRELGDGQPLDLTFLRHETSRGPIVSRNELYRRGSGRYILTLDDDAYLREGDGVRRALAVLEGDASVAVVAMRQVRGDGGDGPFQVAKAEAPCVVQAFYGYGAVLRRDAFWSVGGYREVLFYYHEEPEVSKRLLAAGYRTVYLPDAVVVHDANPDGRSILRIKAYAWRNSCFNAVMNEPIERLIPGLVARAWRLHRYRRGRRPFGEADPGARLGVRWLLRELTGHRKQLMRERRPLPRETFRRWERLATPEPYAVADLLLHQEPRTE